MKLSAVKMSQWAVIFSLMGGLTFPTQAQTQSLTPGADGTGTVVNPNGNRYDITGGSLSRDGANLFHSFQRFGLSQGQVANFLSNPNIRNILGRVTGGEASYINGLIQVTGGYSNLFLMNPAGIVFGPNASLNVPAAFTATTASGIGFNSGWFNAVGATDYASLVGTPSAFIFLAAQPGAIVNAGNLTLQPGENLTLLGGTVINTGTLSSPGGNITIAAVPEANTVRISQSGHLLSLEMQPLSATTASGVSINPLSLPQLLTGGGSESHATGLRVNENGQVFLTGSGIRVPAEGGVAIASGTIDASGQTAGAVNVLGDKVGLIGSHINTSGSNRGGTVLIGGDYQGKGTVPNATRTFVSSDSALDASALDNGNGGKIIIWADKNTAFYGKISALGGEAGGNGGFVEVSGKENLIFRGSVNLSAPNGTTGSLLLDPENITIVAGSGAAEDSEVSSDSQVLFGDGTTTYPISETALESLDGNAEVKLEASNDITIQPLSDSQLTLAAGTGSITFTADADKNGVGVFSMSSTDTIRAEGRNVTISAATINLGNIDTSSATSDGGAIALNALSDIVTGSLRSLAGGSGNGGAIALTSSSGSIDTTAGTLNSSSVNGNGGNIALLASQNLITKDIESTAGEITLTVNQWGQEELLSSKGGRGTGGNITLTSNSGTLNTTAGQIHSYSLDGNGGNITLTAAGNINTGNLASSSSYQPPTAEISAGDGKGNGGNIAINSSTGAVNTASVFLNSSSRRGDAGSVAITAYGNINTGNIQASTGYYDWSTYTWVGGKGGNITLNSGAAIDTSNGALSSNSAQGNGGSIILTAEYLKIGQIGASSFGSGTGGNIALNSSGAIDSSNGWISSDSSQGNGGSIALAAAGDIKAWSISAYSSGSGSGGNITLNSGGAIDTSGGLSSYSDRGNGGEIAVTAAGDIKARSISAHSSGSGTGGNITLNSGGAIDTTDGGLYSDSSQGNGGEIALSAAGDIKTSYINVSSNTGIGGNITLNSGGAIDTSGELSSHSAQGNGGEIALTAAGDIKAWSISAYASGSGTGGNITLNSGGAIDTSNGWLESHSNQGDGGSIALTAAGGIKLGNIEVSSYGSGTGGNIAINSGNAIDIISKLSSSSDYGYGGSIALSANGIIITRSIYSNGGKQGGNITLTSNYSDVDTSRGVLDATSQYGMNGNVTITAYAGNIALGNVSGSGNITVASGGIDEPFNTDPDAEVISDADKINNLSGNVSLFAHNDITVNEPIVTSSISSLELQAGRSININADIDTSGSNGNIRLFANSNAADPSKRNPGSGSVIMATGTTLNAGSGDIRIVLGTLGEVGNVTLSNLRTAGNVTVNAAGGNILRTAGNSLITASSAVFQTSGTSGIGLPAEPIRISVNNLEARSGSGGAFFDSPTQGVTVGGVTDLLRGMSTSKGGAIALSANGDIFVTEPISTSVSSGDSGNITLNASGAIDSTKSQLSSYSASGDAGYVNLTASGDIKTSVIESSSESGSGGNITLNSGGTITTYDLLTSSSTQGDAGSVALTAIGNIRTNTIESRSGFNGRGGNIVLNSRDGAIDTTLGSLSSSSDRGDGGSVIVTAARDIKTGTIKSSSWASRSGAIELNSSGGSIDTTSDYLSDSMLGDGGSVSLTAAGDIKIGSLSSRSGSGNGGDIALNSGGSIDTSGWLSSYSMLGDGGSVTLTAAGNIKIESISSSSFDGSGSGGDIVLNSGGSIDATRYKLFSYSYGGNGGNVTLTARGNIILGPDTDYDSNPIAISSEGLQKGGNISITSSSGNIDSSRGNLNSYSGSGTAGNVTLEATAGNVLTRSVNSEGALQGGHINIISGSTINTTVGTLNSYSQSGIAGNVTLEAIGQVNTGGDFTSSGIRTDGYLQGGDISITSRLSSIDTSRGNLDTHSTAGEAGIITLNAYSDIITSSIRSDGQIQGGAINITSNSGAIALGGTLDSYSSSGSAGNLTLSSPGSITLIGDVTSYGNTESGDVSITSSNNNVTTSAITTQSGTGPSGNIIINGKNIESGNISSIGTIGSGNIQVTAPDGSVKTENIQTVTQTGNSGNIDVNAKDDIDTGDQTTSTDNGNSGNITNNAGGNQTTGNQTTATESGNSGNISNSAGGNQTIGNQTTSTDNGNSGNISNIVGGNQTTGDQISEATGGNSGSLTNIIGGNQATGNQTTSTTNGNSGNIENTVGGNQTAGNQTTTANNNDSGNIVNNIGGNQATGNQTTSTTNGNSGSISNAVDGNQTTGNQTSSTTGGNSGDITNQVGGNQITGNQTTSTAIGNSGDITNQVGGNQITGSQTSLTTAGDSGNISNTAGGAITTGDQTTSATGGNSGNIANTAGDNIITGNLRSIGTTQAGDIAVTSTSGSVTTGNIESVSALGNAGNIDVDALNNVTTGDISSVGDNNSGDITVKSREGAISTGDIESIARNGTAGDITLSAKNGITTGELNSTGALGNGRINVSNQMGEVKTGEAKTGEMAADTGKISANGTPTNLNTQELLTTLNVPNPLPNTNVITAIASDAVLEEIETARLQEFTDYFGSDAPAQSVTLQSAREALSNVERQTGMQSAIAYVNAHPEQLEIVLFTAQGQPIRKSIPAANRLALLKMVLEFRARLTDPRERNTTSYLKSAQQLYQWLIAPIESELQANGIDTLLFSMDSGLRSLPLAALHDGKQFLVEKYSLALIPSVSLMDARYQSLQKTQFLAFGVSEFSDQVPLPAVPLELKAIAIEREGLAFLNEAFTLDNFKLQRQNHPYQIVHLATHAEFVPGAIANSYIQLWDDKLRLDRLRSLRLNNPSVELLVLSACRTALGNEKAEMGFAGLAVLSGVKSALASLWYVSDIGTLGLMSEFYYNLSSAPIKAEALRRAQLAMIRGEVFISEGTLRGLGARSGVALPPLLAKTDLPNLSHPYYWSAFTMIGSPW